MARARFVMEQHLGHRSYYENLRSHLENDAALDTSWVPVTYTRVGHGRQLPFDNGVVRGRTEVVQGLWSTPFDVAFFNTQVPAVLAGRALQGKPFVISTDITPTQYDDMAEHYGHSPDRFPPLQRAKHAVNARRFQQAAMIVPWSNWVRDSLIDDYGVSPERIEVLAPGVDLAKWQPEPTRRDERRYRILFVGGDFARKGGEQLLAAFGRLDVEGAELHIVTRDDVSAGNGVFVYNDFSPNDPGLMELYQSCDVFAFPTRAEAFGVAAVEACAMTLPVIGTGIGGSADIVIDGETGVRVAPDSVDELEQALRVLSDFDVRSRMGAVARERAERYFDAEKQARRLSQILRQAATAEAA